MKQSVRLIRDYLSSVFGSKDKMKIYQQSFMPGEWYIVPEQEIDLERLVLYIKYNPGMKVEMNFHHDFNGTQSSYDQSWQLKAKAAIAYLFSEGIEKSQIISNPFQLSTLPCFRVMCA